MHRQKPPTLCLKRAYETPDASDGYRVLVERLWPRGVKKEALKLDAWFKDIAPSPALRTWFGHDPEKWDDFVKRYKAELRQEPAASALENLAKRAAETTVTLVYAARDPRHNSARIVKELIEQQTFLHNASI